MTRRQLLGTAVAAVGIYGGSLEDTRYVAGEDLDSMYDRVMEEPEVVTSDQVDSMLEETTA